MSDSESQKAYYAALLVRCECGHGAIDWHAKVDGDTSAPYDHGGECWYPGCRCKRFEERKS